jgi:hypothetical protein
MNEDIKQVLYSSWGTGPKQYWSDISSIAFFISASLQHPVPPGISMVETCSTIQIASYKEKFGCIRIYCHFADEELVEREWIRQGNVNKEISTEFKFKCLLHDAAHYRKCYFKMIDLFPHYRLAIVSAADHYELLFQDYNDLIKNDSKFDSCLEHYFKKYHVSDKQQFKEILCTICQFKENNNV